MRWEKKLDVLGPIEQAERCLDAWLTEEKLFLTKKQKRRVTALMARYFLYEDEVTDELMFAFLRRHSGLHEDVDMEDPASVRNEIQTTLGMARPEDMAPAGNRRVLTAFIIGLVLASFALGIWGVGHQKISREEQASLRTLVQQIADLDPAVSRSDVWTEVKGPLHIKSYQDMTLWDYYKSRKRLELRLKELQKKAPL